ncbi:hypothetical protein NQ314_016597 [Rhamnusium bicolor]|uniref:EF-hand domain-containing protein n=1 Tax=Rhamnusium bicolor TaxID=1586634 RepID=A0AAV8WWH5_9CUCU|nr:hypothetical protein NQ314_016597 [Rhamnusium bicolor]
MLKPTDEIAKECVQCDMNNMKTIRKSAILRNPDVLEYYKSIFDKLKEFIVTQEGDEIPEEVIKNLHSFFDKNQDEQLDLDEFLDMINYPTFIKTFQRIKSRYIKFVGISSIRKKSLMLRRTTTNTGLYEEEITFKKYTIGMLLVSIVQMLCFYIDMAYDNKLVKEALQFHPSHRNQIWRYVTYMLVHSHYVYIFLNFSACHLYGNVVIQILIGVPLEMVHSWRVPVIYVAGAFGGCLAHAVVDKNVPLVGGSGGVYAFYSAQIAIVIMVSDS